MLIDLCHETKQKFKMGILSNAPQGFSGAVSALNSLPQGLLAEMCQDVIAFLQHKVGFITDYELAMSSLEIEPKPKAQTCVNALTYVFRSAAEAGLTADALVAELKSSLEWKESTMAVLRHVWKEEGPVLCGLPKEALSVGQLVSMDWKLGVAMSSDSCRYLNSPHVCLQFKVAESPGVTKTHTVEMTIPEFKNFASQLKEMASTLDTAA